MSSWRGTSVLVTGGAGFLGSHIVDSLLGQGCRVTVLDNFSFGLPSRLNRRSFRLVKGNVEDETVFADIVDIEYVFHMGSPSSVILFNQDPRKCLTSTLVGCYNLLTFASRVGVRKVVIPSSGSVYGSANPPQSERTNPKPRNLYALAKLTCEGMVETIKDPPLTVFPRIFAGYGPNEKS